MTFTLYSCQSDNIINTTLLNSSIHVTTINSSLQPTLMLHYLCSSQLMPKVPYHVQKQRRRGGGEIGFLLEQSQVIIDAIILTANALVMATPPFLEMQFQLRSKSAKPMLAPWK